MTNRCFVYQEGEKIADIAMPEMAYWLTDRKVFIWWSISEVDSHVLSHLKNTFGLHDLVIEDIVNNNQRPKIEEYGDSVFIVMHVLKKEKAKLKKKQLAVFMSERFLISIEANPYDSLLDGFSAYEHDAKLLKAGPGSILFSLIDRVANQYFPIIADLENQLDDMESCIFNCDQAEDNVRQLYTIKRRVLELRQVIYPLIEVTGKLYAGRVPKACEGLQNYFRDVHDHLLRMGHTLDVIRETISTAIQANLTSVAIDESKVTKKLAAWAAIFAVGTFMVGVWGMNFALMPELEMTYGYPISLVLILLASGFLYLRFKRLAWL